jgi:hypothetical protein
LIRGSPPPLLYKRGVNPGLNLGFGVLRFGLRKNIVSTESIVFPNTESSVSRTICFHTQKHGFSASEDLDTGQLVTRAYYDSLAMP